VSTSSTELPPGGWTIAGNTVALASIGLLVWGVLSELHTLGSTSQRITAVVLLAAAVISWVLWMYLRSRVHRTAVATLFAMAVTGGALVGFTPVAMVFPALAVFSAMTLWPVGLGAVIGATGWAAMAISVVVEGKAWGILLGGLAALLGGAVVGITRRQAVERTEQLARMQVEMARTEVERSRAELLTERNHLGREIHDVLAHTLAALALQLEAFSTVVDAEPSTSPAVRQQLERTRLLVHEGLEEARGAVLALRDEPAPVGEQLRKLCAQQQAAFRESGIPVALPAPAVVGLYRVAQEALTNIMKHAPGAPTSVDLRWLPDSVGLTIENATPAAATPTPLSRSGGGFGLRGIAERLELLHGLVESGPTTSGWRVRARIPFADGGTPSPQDPREEAAP
jgi:signal transduction histidine kinase